MRGPPIPQRIPPLRWRGPSFIWTPIALALAIGWPAAVLPNETALQRLALIVGAAVFALALLTLGASWALGQAPRTRRVVVLHVLFAAVAVSMAAPFALSGLTPSMSVAMTPLALVLSLPVALISGTVFAWVALARPRAETPDDRIRVAHDVQPFR